jgi:putative heme-binding domain-containing protein
MGTVERQKLSKHGQGSVRERAGKLFTDTQSDRQKVVKSYETVLQLAGDQMRGAMLFQQNCGVCHQFAAHPQVGPDLGTVAGKPIEALLESILDPNRAVEARYLNYTALTRDEREVSGIIVAEGPTSITLRSATGEETVLRRDLQRLTSSGLSLMPEGFEKVLTPQDLADVIAFIRKSDYIHPQNK